ncbi:MAG: universal stress protein [Gammaproteobacteria bacterium]|nr:universal stress protein [Gammaproteobacteria bacterium]MBU1441668.1 universal stress protein [Gammaproteobacteria bacterium]
MNKVIACVDAAPSSPSVCDCAVWAAERLGVPLELLHVLDRHPERAPVTDFSGSIGLGTQEALLEELGALDERRSALAQSHGRGLLEQLAGRLREAGAAVNVETRQRHGGLVESILDLEPETRLFVLGQHVRADPPGKLHIDHHVERVVRSAQRPLLIVSSQFSAPRRFGIAFDGSKTARSMIEAVAASPLLEGLPCTVVRAGEPTFDSRSQLDAARSRLADAGFDVSVLALPGEPEAAFPSWLGQGGADLLVMGAYGHSRIRQLIVGSTTTALLRTSPVPVLVLR